MITEEERVHKYSKNASTILYWLREQNFIRYDSLTVHAGKVTFGEKLVANIKWYCILKSNKESNEYYMPLFDFAGDFQCYNGNQLGYWLNKHMNKELQDA